MTEPVLGTHAGVFGEAGSKLGITSVPDELINEAVEFFVASMNEIEAQENIEDVEFQVELHKSYLVEAIKVEKAEIAARDREALRKRMRTAEPFYEQYYGKLDKLKQELRSKQIVEGIEIHASPSCLPLVLQITSMQKVVKKQEDAAIEFLLGRIAETKTKHPDAFRYYEEVFQASWQERREAEAVKGA